MVLGFEFSWMPTTAFGEAGTNGGHNPVNSSGADMHCISHLSTGLAILEERDDKSLGVWGHVYWGGGWHLGALYIFWRCSHMIFKV